MLICGIDEAGKGPVIGDLVIAGCVVKSDELKDFNKLGVKDSKLLTPEKREELFNVIKNNTISHNIVNVSALEIDSRNKVGCNLNKLECLKMAQIINTLKPDKVIIDCPHPVPEKFKNELLTYLEDKSVEVVAEHKADFKYPLVGAASILAKVTRDSHIKKIEEKLNLTIGSGYPGDPSTKTLLKDYFENEITGLKPYIRHSWGTYKRALNKKEQRSLFDCA